MSRPDQQLRRDVPLFGELGGVEIVAVVAKIGAGILPIAVEKQLVELIGKIVVMSGISPRARHRVELVEAAQQPGRAVQQPLQLPLRHRVQIELQQLDQVVKAAFLDPQRAVHKSLRQMEARPQD